MIERVLIAEDESDRSMHEAAANLLLARGNFAERQRHLLAIAKFDVGEPLMVDAALKVECWIEQRRIELSEGRDGIPPHNSAVAIIADHQELWGYTNEDDLRRGIYTILKRQPLGEPMKSPIFGYGGNDY